MRINDDETPDTDYRRGPWLRTSPASARESGDGTDTTMTFRVNLDDHRSNKTPVTVGYRTVDGTARAGSDYLAASGTLTFAVGDKWNDFDVTVKDDTVDDNGETFEVRLENPSGGGRIHPDKGTATGTITNTEAAVLAATFPSSRFASASHSGSDDRPQAIVAFSEAVAAFDASTPSVAVAGGTVSSVQAHTEDGIEHAYIFFLGPSGRGDVRFTLVDRTDALMSHSRRVHPPEVWLDERHSGQPQQVETPPRGGASPSLLRSTSRPLGFVCLNNHRDFAAPKTGSIR